jgi:hypothetical protein
MTKAPFSKNDLVKTYFNSGYPIYLLKEQFMYVVDTIAQLDEAHFKNFFESKGLVSKDFAYILRKRFDGFSF